jgi:hypothetical protein
MALGSAQVMERAKRLKLSSEKAEAMECSDLAHEKTHLCRASNVGKSFTFSHATVDFNFGSNWWFRRAWRRPETCQAKL